MPEAFALLLHRKRRIRHQQEDGVHTWNEILRGHVSELKRSFWASYLMRGQILNLTGEIENAKLDALSLRLLWASYAVPETKVVQ